MLQNLPSKGRAKGSVQPSYETAWCSYKNKMFDLSYFVSQSESLKEQHLHHVHLSEDIVDRHGAARKCTRVMSHKRALMIR